MEVICDTKGNNRLEGITGKIDSMSLTGSSMRLHVKKHLQLYCLARELTKRQYWLAGLVLKLSESLNFKNSI